MSRQKRIFIFLAIIFFVAIALVAYDISRRTTFPGSKPQLQERLKKQYGNDSTKVSADSTTQKVH